MKQSFADKGVILSSFRMIKNHMSKGLPWTIFRNATKCSADDLNNSIYTEGDGHSAKSTLSTGITRLPYTLVQVQTELIELSTILTLNKKAVLKIPNVAKPYPAIASEIAKPAASVLTSTLNIGSFLQINNHPSPTFHEDGPISFNLSPEVGFARVLALESALRLHDLLREPVDLTRPTEDRYPIIQLIAH